MSKWYMCRFKVGFKGLQQGLKSASSNCDHVAKFIAPQLPIWKRIPPAPEPLPTNGFTITGLPGFSRALAGSSSQKKQYEVYQPPRRSRNFWGYYRYCLDRHPPICDSPSGEQLYSARLCMISWSCTKQKPWGVLNPEAKGPLVAGPSPTNRFS